VWPPVVDQRNRNFLSDVGVGLAVGVVGEANE
jgi:hypothetical protein